MDTIALILICFTMFFGSYVAGFLPLFFSINEKRIRLTNIFSAGLLIGTALCVIIPEGISNLYAMSNKPFSKNALLNLMNLETNEQSNNQIKNFTFKEEIENNYKNQPKFEKIDFLNNSTKITNFLLQLSCENLLQLNVSDNDWENLNTNLNQLLYKKYTLCKSLSKKNNVSIIGISLTLGFLFMFVIDQLEKKIAANKSQSFTTFGFIIHAAADGIAMGSASNSKIETFQIIIFLAIMIHKAPSAFALTSFLIMKKFEIFRIKKHLLIFSLAAPLSTICTSIILQKIEMHQYVSTSRATNAILLFSGGTFLYIAATHILPELSESKINLNLSLKSNRVYFSIIEIIIFVISAMLPFFFFAHSD